MRLENRDLSGFQSVFRTLQRTWPDQPEVRALLFKFLLVTSRGHSIVSSLLNGCLSLILSSARFFSFCMRNG